MNVLISGGAGFLGRGILRRISQGLLDWDVTVLSRDETKQDEAKRRYPFARYVLGDIKDLDRLTSVMRGVDVVIHAAALKYIPEAEINAAECVSVNVDGTRNVIKAAKEARVSSVVGISTDKAVCPVNTYGATKMIMERLFSDEAVVDPHQETVFNCVRYGNVIGSTGSVVPMFQRQYAELGRVKITNPQMTRFWLDLPEAIGLIMTAISSGSRGAIIVPVAKAMTIVDVAKAATNDNVPIGIIGQRPGEKLHEILIHHEESVRTLIRPTYYELLPPDRQVGEAPFTLASHTPHRQMTAAEMRAAIADAAEV